MNRKKGTPTKRGDSLKGLLRNFFCFFAGAAFVYTLYVPIVTKPTATISSITAAIGTSDAPHSIVNIGRPSSKSLHHKWKLWDEMTVAQQGEALKEVMPYMEKYGKVLKKGISWQGTAIHGNCPLHKFGAGTGHKLCGPPPEPNNCSFISFGINDDPSFDREIADEWKCHGFAGDPTVNHPSKLHPRVTFHNLGASMVMENEERKVNKGGHEDWWSTSMPSLRRFLGLERISVMKLDCEGCEVALARDILAEDPDFLTKVDQISIETHVTRYWINSTEHLYYFALQFPLLEEAGHILEWTSIFGCNKFHEQAGCIPELEATGFPCGFKWRSKVGGSTRGRSCQDFLWKRP